MDHLLARSRATEPFKAAVQAFAAGESTDLIEVRGYSPRVKVERVLQQLLSAEADQPIERVTLSGRSGCSDFIGELQFVAAGSTYRVGFAWDCRWRAEQEGWVDYFGLPDQIRAAREFGWDCFERWQRDEVVSMESMLLAESGAGLRAS